MNTACAMQIPMSQQVHCRCACPNQQPSTSSSCRPLYWRRLEVHIPPGSAQLQHARVPRLGRRLAAAAAPRWNPQNVDESQVLPQLTFTPEQAVAAQLDALLANDSPWPNHGVQTAYAWGEDIGGMERSWYFGYSKDLYHFDHFLGQFQNAFPELIGATSYAISGSQDNEDGTVRVDLHVRREGGAEGRGYAFIMARKGVGRNKGCWMTRTVLRAP